MTATDELSHDTEELEHRLAIAQNNAVQLNLYIRRVAKELHSRRNERD